MLKSLRPSARSLALVLASAAAVTCAPPTPGGSDAPVGRDAPVDAPHFEDAFVVDVAEHDTTPTDATPPDERAPSEGELLTMEPPRDLAVGGGYLYFTTDSRDTALRRMPITGGAPQTVLTTTMSAPQHVAADGVGVVWSERFQSTVQGAVRACAHAGCGAMPMAYTNLAESTNQVALAPAHVAWSSATRATVVVCARGGAPCVQHRGTASAQYTPGGLAFDGDELYWVTAGISIPGGAVATPGTVMHCNTAANHCSPSVLVNDPTLGNPQRIALGPDALYVLSNTGLFRVGRDGAGLTRLATVATGVGNNTFDLAADGASVFWAVGLTLSRCDASATCTPTVLASLGTGFTQGLALDATSVYWGTMNTSRVGGIRRFAR